MAISYTPTEEKANSTSHAIGILLGIAASSYFFRITNHGYDIWAQAGIALYAFGILSSYISSTIYHACLPTSRWRERLRKLDHSAIYWHIAGSYSPIIFIGLREDVVWGMTLFFIVWGCALIGSILSLVRLKEHSYIETGCFVAMGLIVLIAFKPVLEAIGWESMRWIIAEGVAFITGAVFYSIHKKKFMHTVFHLFVLLGSVFHILAIWEMLT